MVTTPGEHDSEYFVIPRDEGGEYIAIAEGIAQDQGFPAYNQVVRPDKEAAKEDERLMLLELQDVLPSNVHFPKENPFLVLRVDTPRGRAAVQREPCWCTCSATNTSTGSGCCPLSMDGDTGEPEPPTAT